MEKDFVNISYDQKGMKDGFLLIVKIAWIVQNIIIKN